MVLLLSPLHIAASKDIIPPEAFYKKNVLKNFANFRGKHMLESLFNKVRLKGCKFIKNETQTLVHSCEICEVLKQTYFKEHLQTAASVSKRC